VLAGRRLVEGRTVADLAYLALTCGFFAVLALVASRVDRT